MTMSKSGTTLVTTHHLSTILTDFSKKILKRILFSRSFPFKSIVTYSVLKPSTLRV